MGWLTKLAGGITGNPMLLVWLTAGALALGTVSGGGVAWKVQGWRLDAVQAEFDHFRDVTKLIGEQAQKEAKDTNDLHQKTLEDVSHAWEKELPIARNNAVAAYLARHPVRVLVKPSASCGDLPGTSVDPKGSDGTRQEQMATQQACELDTKFVSDCAEDALKVGAFQDIVILNKLTVK